MNLVVLNAFNITKYAREKLYKSDSSKCFDSLDYAIEAANDLVDVSKKVVILPPESNLLGKYTNFEVIIQEENSVLSLMNSLIKVSEGFDNIFFYNADCPLIDRVLAKKMYQNHIKYYCEYTFADGYPKGITVEIIKTSVLPALREIAKSKDSSIERDLLFSLIEKDINSFELETEISPDDQRLLRISLFPDTKRNFIQLKAISEQIMQDPKWSALDILELTRKQGEILRTLPAFVEFQTTSKHNQKVEYLPQNYDESSFKEISPEDFKIALKKISDFSEDAVISLSIRNEPSLHSSLPELAAAVLDYPMFSLLIETSGTAWNEDDIEQILNMDSSRISWIVDLDALDPDLYKRLRGDGYSEAYSFANKLIKKSPTNTWVQATRMIENEEDNEKFYKHWKEITNNIIIQKYDWVCGKLKQRKITDLSPVKRFPCWHLRRELVILCDGRVSLCREDLENSKILGNIFSEDISVIWNNGQEYFINHIKGEYPELCRKCDEYYTYNY